MNSNAARNLQTALWRTVARLKMLPLLHDIYRRIQVRGRGRGGEGGRCGRGGRGGGVGGEGGGEGREGEGRGRRLGSECGGQSKVGGEEKEVQFGGG